MDSKKYNNLLKFLLKLTRIETGSHMNLEGDFVYGYYINFPFSKNRYGHFVANHTIPDTIEGRPQVFSYIPSFMFDGYLRDNYDVEYGDAKDLWIEYTNIIVNKLINLKSKKNRLNEVSNKSLKSKLLDMINNQGLIKTAKKINGIEYLSKAIDIPIGELVMGQIGNKIISTEDLKKLGITIGGYDFKFQINSIVVQYIDRTISDRFECEVYFTIKEGTVTLIMTNDETYDLLDPKINNKEWKWEVDNEIRDLVYEFVNWYLSKLNLHISDYDIWFDND